MKTINPPNVGKYFHLFRRRTLFKDLMTNYKFHTSVLDLIFEEDLVRPSVADPLWIEILLNLNSAECKNPNLLVQAALFIIRKFHDVLQTPQVPDF